MKEETWGLMIDKIGHDYSQAILSSATQYCRSRGVTLVVFTIGHLSHTQDYDTLYRQIIPFINSPAIDRLMICPAQLTRNGGDRILDRVFQGMTAKPVVCLGSSILNFPSFIPDFRKAFREVLDHLWEVHCYRRFAWVSGPPDNSDNGAREEILRSYLEERGLSWDSQVIIPGSFDLVSGREAGKKLLKHLGEFDIVIAANDSMAKGIREILGDQIPLTGFDNDSAATHGRLTTVDQQISSQVARVFDVLGTTGIETGLGLRLVEPIGNAVFRSSCGCPPGHGAPQVDDSNSEKLAERVGVLYERILECQDLSELVPCLNANLPLENINYWKLVPPSDPSAPEKNLPLSLLPDRLSQPPSELVVHSLFKEKELFGYFIHEVGNHEYVLSEWLRMNLCILFSGWHRKNQSSQVQKILGMEIEKFERRRHEMERVINSLPIWILEIDRKAHIRYFNESFMELLGLTPGAVRLRPLFNFIIPQDRENLEKKMNQCLKSNKQIGIDFQFQSSSGKPVTVIGEIQALGTESLSNLATLFGAIQFGGGIRLTGMAVNPILEGIYQPENTIYKHFSFTNREQDLIALLARGLDTAAIAENLGLSASTVRVELHNIYFKSGVGKKKEFLDLLLDYQSKSFHTQSLTQILLARIFSEN